MDVTIQTLNPLPYHSAKLFHTLMADLNGAHGCQIEGNSRFDLQLESGFGEVKLDAGVAQVVKMSHIDRNKEIMCSAAFLYREDAKDSRLVYPMYIEMKLIDFFSEAIIVRTGDISKIDIRAYQLIFPLIENWLKALSHRGYIVEQANH